MPKCDHCGTEIVIDGCWRCGAPQCCPKCCDEAFRELAAQISADLFKLIPLLKERETQGQSRDIGLQKNVRTLDHDSERDGQRHGFNGEPVQIVCDSDGFRVLKLP